MAVNFILFSSFNASSTYFIVHFCRCFLVASDLRLPFLRVCSADAVFISLEINMLLFLLPSDVDGDP